MYNYCNINFINISLTELVRRINTNNFMYLKKLGNMKSLPILPIYLKNKFQGTLWVCEKPKVNVVKKQDPKEIK